MAKGGRYCFGTYILYIILLLCTRISSSSQEEERKVYIVYMGAVPSDETAYSLNSEHLSLLQQVATAETNNLSPNLMVRNYGRSFNGFAANLTPTEAQALSRREGVVSVFPSQTLHIQTTRSWDFVGLPQKVERRHSVESDIIVGVIDTGVWPEIESFTDQGFGPPPKKWKGACKGGSNFTCNNKIIGARFYGRSTTTARDDNGHGSHTASIAAGNAVTGASFYGLGQGTARGGVPSARVSIYRVCDSSGRCELSDVLAAFDDAIADGVDLITISIGPNGAIPFEEDGIAIGAFHAIEKGILTVQSAGNNGPAPGTIISNAPWIFTVAASTIDRTFTEEVVLGNGLHFQVNAANTFPSMLDTPLVYGMQIATNSCSIAAYARSCQPECLDQNKVKGKILICEDFQSYDSIRSSGAAGAIVSSYHSRLNDTPFVTPMAAAPLGPADFNSLLSYHNSSDNPQARILTSKNSQNPVYPVVATFSSRGPNTIIKDIMKPDITAPGVGILAAYSPVASPSDTEIDTRRVKFNILSGTSMACPHTAGVAAYVKSFHPDWSPSAIKSAIMTSSRQIANYNDSSAPAFSDGSGLVNPIAALQPGLIYEIESDDYVKFLCRLIGKNVTLIIGPKARCPAYVDMAPSDLNVPSLVFGVPAEKRFEAWLNRTVTNVGPANSTYKSSIIHGEYYPNFKVEVIPDVLSFGQQNEKKSFTVKVYGSGAPDGFTGSVLLTWFDGKHTVNTPIVFTDELK